MKMGNVFIVVVLVVCSCSSSGGGGNSSSCLSSISNRNSGNIIICTIKSRKLHVPQYTSIRKHLILPPLPNTPDPRANTNQAAHHSLTWSPLARPLITGSPAWLTKDRSLSASLGSAYLVCSKMYSRGNWTHFRWVREICRCTEGLDRWGEWLVSSTCPTCVLSYAVSPLSFTLFLLIDRHLAVEYIWFSFIEISLWYDLRSF